MCSLRCRESPIRGPVTSTGVLRYVGYEIFQRIQEQRCYGGVGYNDEHSAGYSRSWAFAKSTGNSSCHLFLECSGPGVHILCLLERLPQRTHSQVGTPVDLETGRSIEVLTIEKISRAQSGMTSLLFVRVADIYNLAHKYEFKLERTWDYYSPSCC